MAPQFESRASQRNVILSDIRRYESIHDRPTVALAALRPFFERLKSYLEVDVSPNNFNAINTVKPCLKDEGEDFGGDIEDEDLMLAETSDPVLSQSSMKRANSSISEDEPTSKKLKTSDDSTAITLAESILAKTWGFPHFRLKQQQAISRLVQGGSAVVVFPTGGGKSLVYQIPALAFDPYDERCGNSPGGGVTLVVSPLIALMKVSGGSCPWKSITREQVMATRRWLTYYVGPGRCLEKAWCLCSCDGLDT